MHDAIAAALASLGVSARAVACGEERKLGEILCFLHQTAGDLVVGRHKVVGSAQRKQRGALMQHGAILLSRSPYTPALPGLLELANIPMAIGDLVSEVAAEFRRHTKWVLQ